MYYCFGCGAGGNVFTFLMQYENYTFTEAMQVLADRAGIELPKQEMTGAQKREADKRTKLLEINKEAAKYFYKLLRSPRGEKHMRISVSGSCRMKRCANLAWAIRISTAMISIAI